MSEASPRANRLATPSWLDTRLIFGVVLVLLAVVGGARIFAAADRYTEVYLARNPLVPGEHLRADDLSIGRVRFSGEGGAYVAAGNPPIGYLVTRYVAPGELLPLASVSARPADTLASRLVTVAVPPGHLPADLGQGDLVDVYLTPKRVAGAAVPMPSRVLASVAVDSADGGAQSLAAGSMAAVVLVVPADRVADLVHAVESGTIDLIAVPTVAAGSAPAPAAAAAAGAP